MMNREVRLFGGAMTSELPQSFVDVSQYSPIPDHQEVFADKDTECKLILELNERKDDVSNTDCAAFYFENIAEANRASRHTLIHSENSQTHTKWEDNMKALNIDFSQWNKFEELLCTAQKAQQSTPCPPHGFDRAPHFPYPLADAVQYCFGDQVITRLGNEQVVRVEMVVIRLTSPVNTDIIVSAYVPWNIENGDKRLPDGVQVGKVILNFVQKLKIHDWSLFKCG